jgi:hypothetical protein
VQVQLDLHVRSTNGRSSGFMPGSPFELVSVAQSACPCAATDTGSHSRHVANRDS